MIGELPRAVTVNDREYSIRTDFRDILRIIAAFNDPKLKDAEKVYVCLVIFYEDFAKIPRRDYEDAYLAAVRFIDNGADPDTDVPKRSPRVMDWEQDEAILFPAINRVAGFETRSVEYIHWWTFLGYYMEISEGVFFNILIIRTKRAKGKKLDKWEREFWESNKKLCKLTRKLTAEERAERDRLNALLG